MTVTYEHLNEGQQAAADEVFSFLLSSAKAFRLSGPPGTGKTFTIRHIADELIALYQKSCVALGVQPVKYRVEITATTNKAAEVLSESFGRPVPTIHGFLGLTVRDNYKTGESEIQQTRSWKIHKNTLLFVDEASMIDAGLYGYIDMAMGENSKVIFVGDPEQLPPIFEDLSQVYARPKPEALLSAPVRNAGQAALVALCEQLRESVRTGVFHPIQEVPGVIDYLSPAEAFAFVDQTFQSEEHNARILCFRNERVKEFNEYIRNLRGYPDWFVKGEVLTSNSIVHDTANQVLFRTDQVVRITDARHVLENVLIDEGTETHIQAYQVAVTDKKGVHEHRLMVPADRPAFDKLKAWHRSQKNWPAYFKMVNLFPDFRQRDASTVYKAQGSTYETVLLDLEDLGKCYKRDQLARMLYVGVSRPTTRLFLYGKLPARLF